MICSMQGDDPVLEGESAKGFLQMREKHDKEKSFLLIASDYKPMTGGIAAYLDNLARGLRSLGAKTRVLAVVEPTEKARIDFLENYEDWVSPFPVVNDRRPASWLGSRWVSLLEIARCVWPSARHLVEKGQLFRSSVIATSRLKDILSQDTPNTVIFGHLDRRLYPLVLALRELQVSYGIIAHDVEIYKHPARKVNDRVIRGMMIRGAGWIAANSRHTKSLLEMWGIPKDKVVVVHPPLSEDLIRESSKPHISIREEEGYTLISVCRLVKGKGIDVVLRALKILDEKRIPYNYIIVGDGKERASLEKLRDELHLKGNIQFLGFVEEDKKRTYLRAADVLVMPSRVNPSLHHEGFGMVFIEAAVFGIPGVGSNVGGIPDAVIDGKTGLLVDQESPEKLAEALIFLYENPEERKAMGEAARERAASDFSSLSIAARFQNEVSKRM
jgi:phosphatidyl-myo-inositol dimannoside synthase